MAKEQPGSVPYLRTDGFADPELRKHVSCRRKPWEVHVDPQYLRMLQLQVSRLRRKGQRKWEKKSHLCAFRAHQIWRLIFETAFASILLDSS